MIIRTDRRYMKSTYNSEQAHLISLGIQFYIAGRVTYMSCLIDCFLIVPLLLRYAIEYFLKAHLSFDHTMAELKRDYSHNLNKLWNKYKEIQADTTLDKFDTFILQFDKLEYVRYPEDQKKAQINRKQGKAYDADFVLSFDESIMDVEQNVINWSINTIDEIIFIICDQMRSPVNTIDIIEKRHRKNEAIFYNNNYFKKSSDEGPLYIQL